MEFINPIFEFSRAMNELQLNDAEFALLIAISIFSAGTEEGQEGNPGLWSLQWVRGWVGHVPIWEL